MKPEDYSVSLMSDTKWRKFFDVLVGMHPAVGVTRMKLTYEEEPYDFAVPDRKAEIWESAIDGGPGGPVDYKHIEWINLPREWKWRKYENAPEETTVQEIDALIEALEAVGQFPVEATEDGVRIVGYKR